jgi:hypothetical protein
MAFIHIQGLGDTQVSVSVAFFHMPDDLTRSKFPPRI